MDSLKELLLSKDFDEPSEIGTVKNYCRELFGETPTVSISKNYLVVSVSNSKLASELRLRQVELGRRCQVTKKLFIKVVASKASNQGRRSESAR